MYLKVELPGGYFRIFENITDLVIPKGHNTVAFMPSRKEEAEVVGSEGQIEGVCWIDAVKALPKETQYEVQHIVGFTDTKCDSNPDYIDFIVINRARSAYHSVFVFNNKDKVPTVLCTQHPVFLCNDEGKTMESFK